MAFTQKVSDGGAVFQGLCFQCISCFWFVLVGHITHVAGICLNFNELIFLFRII